MNFRFFGKGKTLEVFQTDYGKVAVVICRDFFHPSILTVAYAKGVDFLFAISNMPLRGLKGEKPQIQETVETASSSLYELLWIFCHLCK